MGVHGSSKLYECFLQEWTNKNALSHVAHIKAMPNSGTVTAVKLVSIEQLQQQILVLSVYESGQLLLTAFSDEKVETVARFQFTLVRILTWHFLSRFSFLSCSAFQIFEQA